MPIDAGIYALANKPNVELESPINQFAKLAQLRALQDQSATGALQRKKLESDMAEDQGVKDYFAQLAPGQNADVGRLTSLSPKTGMAYGKAQQEAKTAQLTQAKTQGEVTKQQIETSMAGIVGISKDPSDEGVARAIDFMISSGLPSEAANAAKQQLLAIPVEQRAQFIVQRAAGHPAGQAALKILFPDAAMQDTGGEITPVNKSTLPGTGATGAMVPGAQAIPKTNTPGEILTDERTRSEGDKNRDVTTQGQDSTRLSAMEAAQARIDAARLRANPEVGKALPNPAVTALGAAGASVEDNNRLASTFKAGYGGKTLLGDLSNTFGRIFGDDTGQAQWWQDMDTLQNQTRHALFGSALTKTELAAWEKTSITPRMDEKQIRENLARRQEIEQRAASKLGRAYAAGGYSQPQIRELLGTAADYLETPAPAVTKQPKGGQTFDTMPDASKYRGKMMDDGKGGKFRSDGKNWVKV